MKRTLLLLMMCCLSFTSMQAQESPPNTNNNFIPGSTSAIVYDIVYNNDMNTNNNSTTVNVVNYVLPQQQDILQQYQVNGIILDSYHNITTQNTFDNTLRQTSDAFDYCSKLIQLE